MSDPISGDVRDPAQIPGVAALGEECTSASEPDGAPSGEAAVEFE